MSGAKNKRARHAAITQPSDPRGQRPAKKRHLLARAAGACAARPLEYRGLSHLRRPVGLSVVRRGAPVRAAAGERLHPLRVYRRGRRF